MASALLSVARRDHESFAPVSAFMANNNAQSQSGLGSLRQPLSEAADEMVSESPSLSLTIKVLLRFPSFKCRVQTTLAWFPLDFR